MEQTVDWPVIWDAVSHQCNDASTGLWPSPRLRHFTNINSRDRRLCILCSSTHHYVFLSHILIWFWKWHIVLNMMYYRKHAYIRKPCPYNFLLWKQTLYIITRALFIWACDWFVFFAIMHFNGLIDSFRYVYGLHNERGVNTCEAAYIVKGLRPVLEGFVVPMHEGACETGSQIPRA